MMFQLIDIETQITSTGQDYRTCVIWTRFLIEHFHSFQSKYNFFTSILCSLLSVMIKVITGEPRSRSFNKNHLIIRVFIRVNEKWCEFNFHPELGRIGSHKIFDMSKEFCPNQNNSFDYLIKKYLGKKQPMLTKIFFSTAGRSQVLFPHYFGE